MNSCEEGCGKIEMHAVHVTEVANFKEDLLRSLESINWKNQVKTDSTVFIKPNITFPYFKDGVTTNPELLKYLLAINKGRTDNVIVRE